MIILLASTRPAKIDGAREALRAIAGVDARFRNPEIQTFDVGHIAPRMPTTLAELLEGARARSAAMIEQARELSHGAWYGVGLEGGMSPLPIAGALPGDIPYALQSWACVTDGERWSYGGGASAVLPAAIARAVLDGEELGDVVDRIAAQAVRGTRGAWGLLTRDLVTRREPFRTAVIAAFAPFYNAALY